MIFILLILAAASAYELSFPQNIFIEEGNIFELDLNLKSETGFSGYFARIHFPEMVDFEVILPSWAALEKVEKGSSAEVFAVDIYDEAKNDMQLMKLKIKGLEEGTGELRIEFLRLEDDFGESIPVDNVTINVTVKKRDFEIRIVPQVAAINAGESTQFRVFVISQSKNLDVKLKAVAGKSFSASIYPETGKARFVATLNITAKKLLRSGEYEVYVIAESEGILKKEKAKLIVERKETAANELDFIPLIGAVLALVLQRKI